MGVSRKFGLVKANILLLSNNTSQHGKATEVTAIQTQRLAELTNAHCFWNEDKERQDEVALPILGTTLSLKPKLEKCEKETNIY